MKRKLALFLSVFMIFGLTACGRSQDIAQTSADSVSTEAVTTESTEAAITESTSVDGNGKNDSAAEESTTETETIIATDASSGAVAENDATEKENTSNILVVYFSATGTTKGIAEKFADGMGADIYEITPEVPYTDADLNYHDNNSRSTLEMNDAGSRPAISGSIENMEQYDVVFIGYPIWWGEAPRILCTFVESYDFSGKTIVPFCTSASSGVGSSATNLEKLTSGADWLAGKRFSGGESAETIMDWVNGLNLLN